MEEGITIVVIKAGNFIKPNWTNRNGKRMKLFSLENQFDRFQKKNKKKKIQESIKLMIGNKERWLTKKKNKKKRIKLKEFGK